MSPNAKVILPRLEKYFAEMGFSRLNGSDIFERVHDCGSNYLILDHNYDRAQDELRVTCGLENKACREFFERLFPNQAEHRWPSILYHSFQFNLLDLSTNHMRSLRKIMVDEGKLFFYRYNDERNLEFEINHTPLATFPYIQRPLRRIAYGLLLAQRFQSPAFPELVQSYKQTLDNSKMNRHFGKIIDSLWRGW